MWNFASKPRLLRYGPKPKSVNPKPSTQSQSPLNPKPETLNPKPKPLILGTLKPMSYDTGPNPNPKGPCAQIAHTMAPKYLSRDYIEAKASSIWLHGPFGRKAESLKPLAQAHNSSVRTLDPDVSLTCSFHCSSFSWFNR